LKGFHFMHADIVNIFPDVLPEDGLLFPLVQFFAEAVHTSPTENSPPHQGELPPLADALLAQGLLRFHCPAPLGADLGRFLSLVQEMRQRPGVFAALALAGSGEAESRNSIISAVRRQAGQNGSAAGDERAAVLWQARLVLHLAELAGRQEAEIRQSLRRIALREQELFSRLRDAAGVSAQNSAEEIPQDSRRSRLRLKAWQTLNRLGSPPPAGAFVSADQDAFELLLEECGAEARTRIEVPLPAVSAGEDFAAKRTAFRQAAAELLMNLPGSFDQQQWNMLLEQHYPAQRHGRRTLTLHFLANAVLFGAAGEKIALGLLGPMEEPRKTTSHALLSI
jgi:hypothetical protein